MRSTRSVALALTVLALGALAPGAGAAATLDEGRLDPSWYGGAPEFREADEIDYLWVKPGFALDGHRLRFVPFGEVAFLGENAAKRDEKDHLLAKQMNATMADVFASELGKAFGSRLSVVNEGEDVRVEGRIVDCSTGSTAAKMLVGFGAGSGGVTFDLKFVDAASGELLLAIHHRSVSGTTWSNTDSKFQGWVEDMAKEAAKKGFDKLYAKGKRVKD
jgi:hypothetical protein